MSSEFEIDAEARPGDIADFITQLKTLNLL